VHEGTASSSKTAAVPLVVVVQLLVPVFMSVRQQGRVVLSGKKCSAGLTSCCCWELLDLHEVLPLAAGKNCLLISCISLITALSGLSVQLLL
jgi:hypothetical protein